MLALPLLGCALCRGPSNEGSAAPAEPATPGARPAPAAPASTPAQPPAATSPSAADPVAAIPAPQPMFRGSAQRTGRAVGRIPRKRPQTRWVHRFERPVYASPTLDGQGRLFVGALDGTFRAITAADGALRWRRTLDGAIYSSAALLQGDPVVGTDGDALFRLSATTGVTRWRLALGPCPRVAGHGPTARRCNGDASPLVVDRTVYMAADSLYAVTAQGAVRWRFALPAHAHASPSQTLQGLLLVATQAGILYAVDPGGKERWRFKVRSDLDSTPAITPWGAAVLGNDFGRIHALDAMTGQQRWSLMTRRRHPVRSSAAVAPDGTVLVGGDDRRLRALRPDGRVAWSFRAGGRIRSSPTVDPDGVVVFGARDHHLYALSPSGKLLWKLDLGADVDSSVAVGNDGTLYTGCDDGGLHALR